MFVKTFLIHKRVMWSKISLNIRTRQSLEFVKEGLQTNFNTKDRSGSFDILQQSWSGNGFFTLFQIYSEKIWV